MLSSNLHSLGQFDNLQVHLNSHIVSCDRQLGGTAPEETVLGICSNQPLDCNTGMCRYRAKHLGKRSRYAL